MSGFVVKNPGMKNPDDLPKEKIVEQMHEMRPLPMGRTAFEEWSDRIISGAMMPEGVTAESQKFALANMLTHIGQTESHKPDAFFIHGLRVCAVKQIAVEMAMEINAAKKAREVAQKAVEQAETQLTQ